MRMKALSYILALFAFPAFIAQAADKAGAVEGMLPTDGSLKRGAHVRAVYPESFRDQLQAVSNALQKLSPEKRTAFAETFTLDQQPAYNADVWPKKEDYDHYIEEMKKVVIQPVTEVAVGLQKGENGTWRVLSVTVDAKTKQQIPLTISALSYDADRNVWISGNGELTAKEYSTPDTSIYGAQTGTEWSLEKEDSMTRMRETIRLTKTTDGKSVYLAYSLVEQSAVTGANIAQGAYLLMFPVQTPGANLGTPGQR